MTNFYVTLRGQIAPSTIGEIFMHGLAIQSSQGVSAVAGAVRTAWSNTWGSGASGIGQHFPAKVQYDEVTVAEILKLAGGDPPVVGTATHALFTPALMGRATVNEMPPTQSAVAVSLSGGKRPNGAVAKGRFYLPPISRASIDPDGLLVAATRDSLATTIGTTFVEQLNQTGYIVSLWSRKWAVMHIVETLRVGNRIDTIRSRRNSNAEQYAIEPITGPA